MSKDIYTLGEDGSITCNFEVIRLSLTEGLSVSYVYGGLRQAVRSNIK